MTPEEFIKDCTRGCSNETTPYGSYDHTYHEWLTPDQARKAVEIAREETRQQMMNEACEWLEPVLKNCAGYNCGMDLVNDFRKAMSAIKRS